MGKVGEIVKYAASLGKNGQSRIASHRLCRWLFSYLSVRDQIESEDSRSCVSTTVSSAVAARAPAGNCSTVARWPSHKRVTSTQLPVGKFQRIVMGHRVVHINLPEAREPLPDFLVRQNTDAERRLTFDILVECDLGTRQQADRNVRLPDRRKTTGNRVVEFRRYQLVLDLGGPARDEVQTIVTHRRHSSSCEKPGFPRTPRTASRLALFQLSW